ncbi:MAG: hypothetical protein DYG83_17125 [Candidatus Brocadia sp. AMX2]|uniref:Uncharacterized protein n=1 Tax=Candidatus Brocadia sinica JPN1 TaxID=1197129 RepID=A0ABQ0K1F7_9BACT|nr:MULTISPECIES: hypothetical protein [Brocadia]MBC6933935.1 hypothetical protein [Candidatus Brocadia sp.]MBL1168820.1 hypothetical protein [Candidatus Brocadia sp. AMX1]MCK6470073.1 hypothetical protein [Candidatus Brocadia sinica]NOG42697.1 hypothetical protein [Planctomycetota bacterium]KAA0241735.1 MAG: hypothetical protein EDM70_17090 [Candidatus Brocadia sp. AMX2]
MLDDLDGVAMALMRMLRVLLAIFQPSKENKARHNHYGVNNSKSCHFSASCLSITRPTRTGIMVAIIPTINIQYFKLAGFAN